MTRVLVTEDSVVARALLVSIINRDPDLEVVGEARDGEQAVKMAAELQPDVITMDVHMPKLDGLEATRRIMAETPKPIVVISAVDPKDVKMSVEAMSSGALAVLAKPSGPTAPDFNDRAKEIVSTIKTMAGVRVVKRRPRLTRPQPASVPTAAAGAATATPKAAPAGASSRRKIEVVAIGSSTGGPDALGKIIGALPGNAPVPILIVQHITVGFHQGLVDWLNNITPLRVRLGEEGHAPMPGEVILAPGEHHMSVDLSKRLKLTEELPVRGHRPSATHLFRSVASVYGAHALGVILTGMGDDGADGLVDLRRSGGWVIGQDEATCVVYGMPREAAARGAVSQVLPLPEIAGAIVDGWNRGRLRVAA
ncbi:MAG TPA: chemotaxis-specific protein-glutamate methyltransferase CheB [Thermoleophilaceae bacterium]